MKRKEAKSERKTKEKEMIEKLTLSIITMKFSRFITAVFFIFFYFLYLITLTIMIKAETRGPLNSKPSITITFRFF